MTGVSVVFGNAPLAVGTPIARRIAAAFGPAGLPVHEGAAAPGGGPTPASRALAATLRERRLTVLALGPATNLAEVIRGAPELAARLDSVVLVIGRRPAEALRFPGGAARYPDFNFELDPAAAETVLASGAPITLVPFGFAVRLPITEADWSTLWDTPFGGFFRGPIEDYLDWFEERTGLRATYPFDSYAVSSVVAPHLLECSTETAAIRSGPRDADSDAGSGGTGRKPWLITPGRGETGGWPVTWCHTPDPGLRDDLLRRLGEP